MRAVLQFFQSIGKLKELQRRGVLLYGYKKADTASDHSFRLAVMVWTLGKGKHLNMDKALEMALVHDFPKVYTGDITPYDGLFSKTKKKKYALAWRWRRLSLSDKRKRYAKQMKKEQVALAKLLKGLPPQARQDIQDAWEEFKKMETPEAKFVHQVDRIENLLEAVEAHELDPSFPTLPWWEHADEVVQNETLVELLETISEDEIRIDRQLRRKKRS